MKHHSSQLLSMAIQNARLFVLNPNCCSATSCHFQLYSLVYNHGMAIGWLKSNLSQMLMCYISVCQAFRLSELVLSIMGMMITAHCISHTGWEAWVHLKMQEGLWTPCRQAYYQYKVLLFITTVYLSWVFHCEDLWMALHLFFFSSFLLIKWPKHKLAFKM